jgi:hypothetical protein
VPRTSGYADIRPKIAVLSFTHECEPERASDVVVEIFLDGRSALALSMRATTYR